MVSTQFTELLITAGHRTKILSYWQMSPIYSQNIQQQKMYEHHYFDVIIALGLYMHTCYSVLWQSSVSLQTAAQHSSVLTRHCDSIVERYRTYMYMYVHVHCCICIGVHAFDIYILIAAACMVSSRKKFFWGGSSKKFDVGVTNFSFSTKIAITS